MGVRLEPVGPLPAATYWRRRAVLLAVLVVLVLLLAKACTGGGGGDGGAQVLTPPGTTTSPAAAPTTPVVTPSTAPSPEACTTAGGLRIVAVGDRRTYALGTTARLTLTITNAGTAPCAVGLGQGSLEFRVASGDDRIWSSDDCSPGGAPGTAVLAPGAQRVTSLSWSLTRSAPGCKGTRTQVKPGTYVLAARVGTLVSPKFPFQVTPKA